MNEIRRAYELRNELAELYSYILLYAPEFPEEDQIDLEQAFARLYELLDDLLAQTQAGDQEKWLRVARLEAQEAHKAFGAGDDLEGARIIQRSEEHLGNRFTKKQIRPTFVVDPDGGASKV